MASCIEGVSAAYRATLLLAAGLLPGIPGSVLAQDVETLEVAPRAPEKAISRDGQFHVHGESLELRSGLVGFAEGAKREYRQLVRDVDEWEHPIVFLVKQDPVRDSRAVCRPVQVPGGYSLQIHVLMGADFQTDELRAAILHMLMLEQCLRRSEQPPEGDPIPRWLREGLPEALLYRERGEPSSLYASIFGNGQVLSATEILESIEPEADSISRAIYRASACGFVYLLLDQPSGSRRLSSLISGLGSVGDTPMRDVVARHFPSLRGTARRMEKWWALQAMHLAERRVLERLSAEATEQGLAAALSFSYVESVQVPADPGEGAGADVAAAGTPEEESRRSPFHFDVLFWRKGRGMADDASEAESPKDGRAAWKTINRRATCPVAEYGKIIDRPDRGEIIRVNQTALMELSVKAFPLYEPILRSYQELLARLEGGRTRGIDAELRRLDEERAGVLDRVAQVADYLNWYEVTQTQERSGAFREYRRRVIRPGGDAKARDDKISQYLDSLEAEFE